MTPEIKKRIAQIQQGEVPEGYQKVGVYLAPKDWKSLKIKNIYSERKEPGEEGLPILTVSIHSGVSDGELDEDEIGKAVKRIEDKSQYKKAHRGDLVFNMMRAWQGAVGAVRTTGMVSPAYIVAKPNDRVDPFYMDYYMKTPEMIHTMHSQSYGVTDFRLRLYWDSFTPIPCVIPSVAEQQKISEILTMQDRLIELKEKLIAEKQRQKKYLMQQLLTGQTRLPGFKGKWKQDSLGNVCEIIKGKQRNKNTLDETGEYYVLNGGIAPSGFTDAWNVTANTISISEGGNSCGFVSFNRENFWSGGHCYTLQSLSSRINILYLYSFLKYSEKSIMDLRVGSGLPNIQKSSLSNFCVILPTIPEQEAIADILSTADREIELLQRDLEQEKQKKKALMQLMLTGIVRV